MKKTIVIEENGTEIRISNGEGNQVEVSIKVPAEKLAEGVVETRRVFLSFDRDVADAVATALRDVACH